MRELLSQAHQVAEEFRSKETELIEILKRLDATKAFRMTGYNSLFQFCVESLLLTEHQAYNYITVSRKCTEIPELMVALEDRRITVSKARRMASVISRENQKDWIDLAAKSSQRDLEKAVRARDPQPPVRDHLQIISSTEIKLQATLDHSVNEKLLRVLELLSEKTHKRTSINEALDQTCDLFLNTNEPLRKAKRAIEKQRREDSLKQRVPNSACAQKSFSIQNFRQRSPIPMKTKHLVWARDRGQCRFHQNGKRCKSKRHLQIHHRKPVSKGGGDELENLVLVCAGHHGALHFPD